MGVIFQSRQLGWLPTDIWGYLWPLLVVLVGAWLMLARSFRGSAEISTADYVRSFVAFGGANPRNDSSSFRGGSITSLFGGDEVDLRGAQLASDGADLDVTVLFGGAEIIVPSSWRVHTSGLPLLGEWNNETRPPESGPSGGDPASTLKVDCFVAFGGIKVRN